MATHSYSEQHSCVYEKWSTSQSCDTIVDASSLPILDNTAARRALLHKSQTLSSTHRVLCKLEIEWQSPYDHSKSKWWWLDNDDVKAMRLSFNLCALFIRVVKPVIFHAVTTIIMLQLIIITTIIGNENMESVQYCKSVLFRITRKRILIDLLLLFKHTQWLQTIS